jgi:hypothetical protein
MGEINQAIGERVATLATKEEVRGAKAQAVLVATTAAAERTRAVASEAKIVAVDAKTVAEQAAAANEEAVANASDIGSMVESTESCISRNSAFVISHLV